MKRHAAEIDNSTNVVTNLVVIDDASIPMPGHFFVDLPARPDIGWLYDPSSGFSPPPAEATPISMALPQKDIEDLLLLLQGQKIDPARLEEIKQKIPTSSDGADGANGPDSDEVVPSPVGMKAKPQR